MNVTKFLDHGNLDLYGNTFGLWGRRLKLNVIFGDMIIVLANKSIMMHGYDAWL